MPPNAATPTRVWDLPTRLFHWTLAASVIGSVITGHVGGSAQVWHVRLGYLAFGLIVFRVVWGFVGGRWSRFGSFIFSPSTVLRYLRGQTRADDTLDVGHSPLGAFSVFALLGVLGAQVATGLVSDDEIAFTGPLYRFVSSETALSATSWHKDLGQWILVALVALHVAAIVFYRLRRGKDLVGPMVSGDKLLPAGTPASTDTWGTRALALAVGAAAAVLVNWVVGLGG